MKLRRWIVLYWLRVPNCRLAAEWGCSTREYRSVVIDATSAWRAKQIAASRIHGGRVITARKV